jgi:hypothetical protein
MHRRSLGRLAALIASVTLLLLVSAPSALGKEGVSVNLVAPLPREAKPGSIVAAFFTMKAISDDVESPLHNAKVFIRLYGPSGAVTEAAGVEQKTPGLYKAMIEIPAGGVAWGEFGIHGKVRVPSGKVVATDPVWSYDGLLETAAVPPPVDPKTYQLPGSKPAVAPANAGATTTGTTPTSTAASEPAASTFSLDPRLALAAGLGLVAIVAGGLLGRRRRLQRPTVA